MNSAIFLDGIAVYASAIYFVLMAIAFIVISMSMINSFRENDELRDRNRIYVKRIQELEDKLYRATYNPDVPNIGKGAHER